MPVTLNGIEATGLLAQPDLLRILETDNADIGEPQIDERRPVVLINDINGRVQSILRDQGKPEFYDYVKINRGIFKKCVNSQAVYPLSEKHGLEAQERR